MAVFKRVGEEGSTALVVHLKPPGGGDGAMKTTSDEDAER